jgi:hypothetical protein
MFCGSEKVGKIQRFAGESSHEEQKMESTVGQKVGRTDENVAHTKKMRERTGLNCANNNEKTESNEKTCSKSSVVVALCLLPTEN